MIVQFSPSKLLTHAGTCLFVSCIGVPFIYLKTTQRMPFYCALGLTLAILLYTLYSACLAFKQWHSTLHSNAHALTITDTGIEINLSPLYSFYKNYFSGFVPFSSITNIELTSYTTWDSATIDLSIKDQNLPAHIHLPEVFNPTLDKIFPLIQAKRLKQVLKVTPLNIYFAVPEVTAGNTEFSIAGISLFFIFIATESSYISLPSALLCACIMLAALYSIYRLRKRTQITRCTVATAFALTDQGIDFVSPLSNIYNFQGFVPWNSISKTELSTRQDISNALTLHVAQPEQNTQTIIIPDKLQFYLEVLHALITEYTNTTKN